METIRISKTRQFLNLLARIFHYAFLSVGLRGNKKFWGLVYDASTKQPLDPVIVKLIGAGDEFEPEVQTCITDMKGRYGFLVGPGKYKILAKKTNYVFPSTRVVGSQDGDFLDVYHGEFFEVTGGSEVIAPNIPMDKITRDWNQEAKAKVMKYKTFWQKFFFIFWTLGFWAFFSLTLVYLILDFKANLAITRSGWLIIFCIYIFSFILNGLIPQARLWGEVLDKNTRQPINGLTLELKNPVMPDLFMARTTTTQEGRFFLRVNPGLYKLEMKINDAGGNNIILGRVEIRVSNEALVNQTFWIDWQKGV